MNVESIATKNVITVRTGDSILAASKLLREKGIRHLPVVDADGKLAGMLTDRDIKRASASEATSLEIHELLYLLDKLDVSKVMTKNPLSVNPNTPVSEAAALMVKHKIGCLPVVDGSRVCGIVTQIDMLRLLASGGT
jgi:acetoin utilization protein AcuB